MEFKELKELEIAGFLQQSASPKVSAISCMPGSIRQMDSLGYITMS
ncbi:hypothetical protein [Mucilaginibacter sp. SP1R1]|nr:hypothetical protein [Mucilaginibacter sp. SP1R1]MBB6150702.1 hypothetical protein [Mucilaginibacter sp. SP1R1]